MDLRLRGEDSLARHELHLMEVRLRNAAIELKRFVIPENRESIFQLIVWRDNIVFNGSGFKRGVYVCFLNYLKNR